MYPSLGTPSTPFAFRELEKLWERCAPHRLRVVAGFLAEQATACQHVSRYVSVVVFRRPSDTAWISAQLKSVVILGGARVSLVTSL